MAKIKKEIIITTGYNNRIEVWATINGVKYKMDIKEVEQLLTLLLDRFSYTTGITVRQKYPRLKINIIKLW